MNKKKQCQVLSAVVSICSVISVISSMRAIVEAHNSGVQMPYSMILMSLATIACTVAVWHNTRNMED